MLIHTCCADCFLKFYQALSKKQQADCQIFFYNPNIYPREEYNARLLAVKKVVKSLNRDIKIIVANYLPQQYFQALKKLNINRENHEIKQPQNHFTVIPASKRCPICWKLRLRALFDKAKEKDISQVSSTLFSSNYQDLAKIKVIADRLSTEYQIDFYLPKIGKTDRDQINKGFYKQNYCGCLYSLIEKSREKYQL
jgi:predicted adenine nucleotide alpha hydrolase (AANH) superfamily ATPase